MALTLTRNNVRPLDGAIVRNYVVGGSVSVQSGDQVYVDSSDTVQLARGNATGTAKAFGFVVGGENNGTSFAPGQTVAVCVKGPIAGFTGMDNTKRVYTSTATAGASTQTTPTGTGNFVNVSGYPIRTDVLMVDPQMTEPTAL